MEDDGCNGGEDTHDKTEDKYELMLTDMLLTPSDKAFKPAIFPTLCCKCIQDYSLMIFTSPFCANLMILEG